MSRSTESAGSSSPGIRSSVYSEIREEQEFVGQDYSRMALARFWRYAFRTAL
jgi:hypothetical protein